VVLVVLVVLEDGMVKGEGVFDFMVMMIDILGV